MPRRTSSTPPRGGSGRASSRVEGGPDRVIDMDVNEEMRSSFLEYAYSVIYSRALPDARDGLKPVQRRILYQMGEMGLRPDRGHVKSARVVGEVMGRLHPHGDSAIYDALVRMAQPFTLRLPLVDGHGNFGSLDDGPAAMRYTECRLAPAAVAMTSGIDEDVIDLVPNYDGREREPVVLPAAFPALLVNGAAGIAVGMATAMAPHNLGEVTAAARHLVMNPTATTAELLRFVPGPDLPGGGAIIGLDGVREAYVTGRGSFRMRATTRIEQVTPRRRGIVVTELPFGVGPERVIERIKDLVSSKRLQGISDIVDLTDGQHGLRLVIEVAPSVNPEALLAQLYRQTPLEEAFNINAVALVDGEPRTLGLRELLEVFVTHRLDVTRRRSDYRRRRASERLHLVEGLLIAIVDIDEVIQVIRTSDDAAQARERLISVFDLSTEQATYILDMPLRRLTKFSRIELEQERTELAASIDELTAILDDEARLRGVVADDLLAVAEAHATPRRTVLLEDTGAQATADVPLEIADGPCRVLLSGSGLLARTTGPDIGTEGGRAAHDVIVSSTTSSTRGAVALITSRGRALRLPVVELPALPASAQSPALAGGAPLGALVDLPPGERVLGVLDLTDPPAILLVGTRLGTVKRTALEQQGTKDSWEVIALADGDEVVGACEATDADDIVLISSDAQLLTFPASAVRVQGRGAAGMAGLRLGGSATMISCGAVPSGVADAEVVTIAGSLSALPGTSGGSVKVSRLDEFPAKGRGTSGVRCQRLLRGEDALVVAWAGIGPARAASPSGLPVDLPAGHGKRDASGTPLPGPVGAVAGPAR
ncbi:MAG: DNA topoisomerase (ATP-hydrolyzing) subunit A [Actinomycetota bacterium]